MVSRNGGYVSWMRYVSVVVYPVYKRVSEEGESKGLERGWVYSMVGVESMKVN